ncbi:MAG: four helix bundle protein [candidate division Zixibacteria bacterium]|nr:four helix bundle protein [Candidatus Tariuqbacter arcticus]
MKSYKELEVWRKAIELVEQVYSISKNFPNWEKFGLISQMQRAAVSIPSNIAEGWGRSTTLDYIHFLRMSRGSLLELETQVIIAERLKYITDLQSHDLFLRIEIIGKMLNSLIKSLKSKTPKS